MTPFMPAAATLGLLLAIVTSLSSTERCTSAVSSSTAIEGGLYCGWVRRSGMVVVGGAGMNVAGVFNGSAWVPAWAKTPHEDIQEMVPAGIRGNCSNRSSGGAILWWWLTQALRAPQNGKVQNANA